LKVFYVEYIPTSGRSIFLTQIDPLKLGNCRIKGTTPQYWYEYGAGIHIEPMPNAIYSLRLFVADNPKKAENISSFTVGTGANEWTESSNVIFQDTADVIFQDTNDVTFQKTVSDWIGGKPATHTGTISDLTYNTILEEEEYTLEFLVSTVGIGGTITPHIGTMSGIPVSSVGYSTQTIVAGGGNPTLRFTALNDIVIDELLVLKRSNLVGSTDQLEISAAFQHNIALAAVSRGLTKNKQNGPAQLLNEINNGELEYLKQNIVDIIPNGRNSLVYM